MSRSPLETLIELADEAQQEAARLLASERRNQKQLADQLTLLETYRSEYAERLDRLSEQGITRGALDDYQRFMRSLDRAMDAAREGLATQTGKVEHCQARWREERVRLGAFSTLSERRDALLLRQEARSEARRLDEFSNNQFVRARQQQATETQQ